jgi:hypothetical protein
MKCAACSMEIDLSEAASPRTGEVEKDWLREAPHKCYHCYLDFLYHMYGGMLEPTISVGGILYQQHGSLVEDEVAN